MKNYTLTTIIAATLLLASCETQNKQAAKKPKFKYVVLVTEESKTYPVIVTEHSNNALKRTAGGALIGGTIGLLTGHSILKTAGTGGLIGAATNKGETTKQYTKMQTDIYYTITFNDSSIDNCVNYCRFTVGDSVWIGDF